VLFLVLQDELELVGVQLKEGRCLHQVIVMRYLRIGRAALVFSELGLLDELEKAASAAFFGQLVVDTDKIVYSLKC